ncbi:MAG: hypothetical protein ACI4F5_07880 [Acutalibacteraceae bacterium]
MRTIKRETLIKMYVVSLIIGLISIIAIPIIQYTSGLKSDSMQFVLMIPLALIVFPIEICGFIINWKKILKGFIAPIPIISYFIQYIVGTWYSIKGLIAIFKHTDLVIGKPEEADNA